MPPGFAGGHGFSAEVVIIEQSTLKLLGNTDMIIRKAAIQGASAIYRSSCEDLGCACNSELVFKRLKNPDPEREMVFVAPVNDTVTGHIHAEIYNILYFETMINIFGLAVSSDYRRC